MSALTRNEELTIGAPQALPKKCKDPGIFSVPCTIGECTFANAMLDVGASINVIPTSIYRAMNFGDLEPIRMTIQLANRSIVQPLGVLEDVLVQVNELIFPTDFYVLDMEDETPKKESTLILGRPFLMTVRTKIDVHARALSMEFGDTLVQFNIFEAMKHPTKDHSLFGINMIEEVVEEYFQLDSCSEDIEDFSKNDDVTSCLGSITEEADSEKPKAENMSAHLVPIPSQVGQTNPKSLTGNSSSTPPPMVLKPLPNNLKYAYLDNEQQLPVIIANNLRYEQEDKLLNVLRQHNMAIGWKLLDLPGINPSICMHRILMEEEIKPIRQQQRRLNPTILDVVKKGVTKLLAVGIIYPISDSQWVSHVQVVPKKSGMTVMKNQQDELVPIRIQNSWRVCIDYRRLNQETRKNHFPLPFIDQVLEKLSGKSHYCFLDGFSRYMQIHIAPEDQHKTTFTCPFGTFAYTRMPFGLCNALSTFQRCMISIFSDLLQNCMEVFMDDFTVYANSFNACLENLSKVLRRCIDTNLVLNFEKCHFMVTEGIVLGHLISNKSIEVDKSKIDIITSLPNPTSVREVHSFLGHTGFYRRFIKNFTPNWDLSFELICDASNSTLGAVLSQRAGVGQPVHVITYASRTMDPAQQNYTTTKKELLAIVFALDKFFSYLLGSRIVVFSDHAALRYLLKKPDGKPRLIRWVLLLQEFNIEIRDKKGAENFVADHLSRIERRSEPMPIKDQFPDEKLLHINTPTPWFTDICNFVVASQFPPEASCLYKEKLQSDAKYYI
ncbi:Retrovirus-related Pol polyprotein from transposon 17.6, partial [Mucuna pruriens]